MHKFQYPTLTPLEALEAIKARINGVWDNPQLEKIGALFTQETEDIITILSCVPEIDQLVL